jgi:hypothetical protein
MATILVGPKRPDISSDTQIARFGTVGVGRSGRRCCGDLAVKASDAGLLMRKRGC